jgi:hypothetical protein
MSDAPSGSTPRPAASSVGYRIIRAMFVVLFFWVFWKFGGYVVTVLVIRHFGSWVVSDAYFFATQAVVYGLMFTPALAVLNPNPAGCAYPCNALCGAGVAFKLAQLLLELARTQEALDK